MKTSVELCRISNRVLKGVDLQIVPGELLVMVGPSGAGKTTLLNAIAGLTHYEGRVLFDGDCMNSLPPHKRRVGYCFQDLLLFPHLTVKKNLLLAMNGVCMDHRGKENRADELLARFQVSHLDSRLPHTLSGGEKQRVAVARAVASEPRLLLLDEPFANLDFRTSRYLRQEFKRFQKQLGLTTLFVTHNLYEARELGDRVTVLRAGRIERTGSPEDPGLGSAAGDEFLQKPNLLACPRQSRVHPGLIQAEWAGLTLLVPDEGRPFTHLSILPHEIYISPLPPPGPPINRFVGRTRIVERNEDGALINVAVGMETLRVQINQENLSAMGLQAGDSVYGILKLRALRGCTVGDGHE